jgi:ribosomal protein S12 methylthiotransferase accessory factor
MPDFIYYKAEIADTGIYGLETNRPTGGGTSLDRDKAMAKALGESVERYSSAIYFRDTLPLSAFRNLPQKALHPVLFKSHRSEQIATSNYPLDQFDEDALVRWVPAIHLATGAKVLVPAGLVYCPYTPETGAGEARVAESISTGLAAHCSYEEAAINGILEVIERDHFMLHWYARKACPVIRPESMTALHREMIERFTQFGYQINILDATADTRVPSVIAIMHGQREGAVPMVVAAATHLDPEVAVSKSIEELALMERLCKRAMISTKSWPAHEDYSQIRTLADHLKWWLNPEMVPQAGFLLSKSHTIDLDEIECIFTDNPSKDLSTLLQCIERTNHEVYISDVTSADIAALGMHVVRALIPGYVPLTISYHCRPEGNERLQGFIEHSSRGGDSGRLNMNPLPHPFA